MFVLLLSFGTLANFQLQLYTPLPMSLSDTPVIEIALGISLSTFPPMDKSKYFVIDRQRNRLLHCYTYFFGSKGFPVRRLRPIVDSKA